MDVWLIMAAGCVTDYYLKVAKVRRKQCRYYIWRGSISINETRYRVRSSTGLTSQIE
jgi:hypothetical protein